MKKTLWENESVDEWGDTYKTDVTAVYFTTVAFLPLLQKASKKRGTFHSSVIVISSMSGIMRHAQGHFSYNAAKGATAHLTKLMSAEFQQLGIRVNSIAPGYFPSEMTTNDSGADQKSHLPDEKVQEKGHVPIERGGTDQEMAMAVVSDNVSTALPQGDFLRRVGLTLNDCSSSWQRIRTLMVRSLLSMVVS
jgi:NAD(P)-dependent dehydrogenase (short-subunit alcohol dehydrogenase family)